MKNNFENNIEYKIENCNDYFNCLKQKEYYLNLAKDIAEKSVTNLNNIFNMSIVVLTNDLINNVIVAKLNNLVEQYKNKKVKKIIKKFVEVYPNFKNNFEETKNFQKMIKLQNINYIFNEWSNEIQLLNKLAKNCIFESIYDLNKSKIYHFCLANQNEYLVAEKSLEKIEFLIDELKTSIQAIFD